jgi:hypothetical protein
METAVRPHLGSTALLRISLLNIKISTADQFLWTIYARKQSERTAPCATTLRVPLKNHSGSFSLPKTRRSITQTHPW